jgi:hypothetical protein
VLSLQRGVTISLGTPVLQEPSLHLQICVRQTKDSGLAVGSRAVFPTYTIE